MKPLHSTLKYSINVQQLASAPIFFLGTKQYRDYEEILSNFFVEMNEHTYSEFRLFKILRL